ncbi:hypothetical protein CEUSTIGMA_g3767.t1 [Chlamydomonas eustigma]|uniref:Uncharacterized protein n=1 Tax=Chlamydomonas eustigma TaxID=1157962 RepID=A0A250WZQ9_9CHLO|nr:hypothetical protein CEUSTIGMA_g3767.t1 [Chlamydomonas eustigma]|eukprot:GAX76321.1 hypothetical protein CEUSTIGMA_g3767.t1 [Chlamydomonas eustigma]
MCTLSTTVTINITLLLGVLHAGVTEGGSVDVGDVAEEESVGVFGVMEGESVGVDDVVEGEGVGVGYVAEEKRKGVDVHAVCGDDEEGLSNIEVEMEKESDGRHDPEESGWVWGGKSVTGLDVDNGWDDGGQGGSDNVLM